MSAPRSLPALLACLAVVAAVAVSLRLGEGLKRPRGPTPEDGWFSIDPDGLYHTRRVARALEEGLPIAETDPYLNHPNGAAIPWPPYYDTVLYALCAPLLPADDAPRRAALERRVATWPVVFGVGSALAAALAAWCLARGSATWRRAGLAALAGALASTGWGAINYSRLGTGDHHAWVGMLCALMFLGATLALAGRGLRRARSGLLWGAACGVCAGLLLGSWVASLLYVLVVQALCGWLLVRRARDELPGAAPFGLGFHAAALLVLLPAVLSSPWKQELPWIVINLSWFHAAWLGLGALAFVAPAIAGAGALGPGTRAARVYPWAVVAGGAALAGLLWLVDAAPARGIAEGFAWVSRADSFMNSVRESAPLLGPRAPEGELFLALGYGVLAVPFVWAWAAWRAFARREDELLPWVLILPLVLVQALTQKRFSDSVMVPMAVLLAWAAARPLARLPQGLAVPLGLIGALLLGLPSILKVRGAQDPALLENLGGLHDPTLGERTAIEWIHGRPSIAGAEGVLAHWDRGHVIEWAADRPTVATNFGSYVGIDAYRDPARFFLETDPARAEDLLARRGIGHVFVPVTLPRYTASMAGIAGEPLERYFLNGSARNPTETWRLSMLARLVNDGLPLGGAGEPLDFLRLVHASTRVHPGFPSRATGRPRPAAFVWERVQGALVECAMDPGRPLTVTIELAFDGADCTLRWSRSAPAGPDGRAALRVPYSTEEPNGDARVTGATWQQGAAAGELRIPELAVVAGRRVTIE